MPPGAKPRVPPGFLRDGGVRLRRARAIRVAPNGDLFVANSAFNPIHVLRVPCGTASPTKDEVFASGLTQPFEFAFYPLEPNPELVYVANCNGVVRFPDKNGDLVATAKPEQIVGHIPWVHHWTRDIAFTRDGKRLLLSVGSGSDVALDMFPEPEVKGGLQTWIKSEVLGAARDTEERRADVLSYDPDGKHEKILVTGLRNCAGITIQPPTGLPWCAVNERDGLGDNTSFEYATAVKDSSFYGWPWYFIGSNEDPRHKSARSDLKGKVTVPDVLMQAHSAPLQIVF